MSSNDRKAELLDQESGSAMVQVVAPLTLNEGATFAAKLDASDGRFFTVTVPAGGVVEGQSFMVPLPPDFNEPRINAPYGRWKDGLFDFLSLGVFHSSFCCALCCTQIAMGQVMQRARLDWLGAPTTKEIAVTTFKTVLVLSIASLFFSFSLNQYESTYWENGLNSPSSIVSFRTFGEFLFFLWSVYALYRTRRSIRERYGIPENKCEGCEDLCCSIFCSCCTVAQMSRHTGEYETYKGVYCSATGLSPDAPLAL